jgi:hypothetical protein
MGDGAGRDDHVKRVLAQHLVCNRDIPLRAHGSQAPMLMSLDP